MKFFQDLGTTIHDRWKLADFDQAAFPEIASTALVERPPSSHVDPMEVVRWVHETSDLVSQGNVHFLFGQPPVTVYRREGFHVDVLFWVDGTTSIHQHAFSGAFHVMAGSSLESTHTFTPERRYSERLMTGNLHFHDVALRTKGDVATIHPGTGFIHSLFHLDRPSVSVVVRTNTDRLAGPQYTYLRGGLAYDPFEQNESTVRQTQTLDLLSKLDNPEWKPLAQKTVRGADAFSAFTILHHMSEQMSVQDDYFAFLDSIRPAHNELIDVLVRCETEERRVRHISAQRKRVKQPEHRFFLALLMNLSDRTHILQMVARAYPERDPAETVVRWLDEITKLDAIHAWASQTAKQVEEPTLDVSLNASSLRVLKDVLDDKLVDDGGAKETQSALEKSFVLRPLFVGKDALKAGHPTS